jgi:hypothetical protein
MTVKRQRRGEGGASEPTDSALLRGNFRRLKGGRRMPMSDMHGGRAGFMETFAVASCVLKKVESWREKSRLDQRRCLLACTFGHLRTRQSQELTMRRSTSRRLATQRRRARSSAFGNTQTDAL